MLSYQHMYHAGGLADVHKHGALAAVLAAALPLFPRIHYIETHAGRGFYQLTSREAQKTGEAAQGITRLEAQHSLPPHLAYAQTLSACRKAHGAQAYAGSPLIAAHLLRPSDRLSLMELHPKEYAKLAARFSEKHIRTYHQDGLVYAPRLANEIDAQIILFIDPSYEQKHEYEQIAAFALSFAREHPTAVILVWYPRLKDERHLAMKEAFSACGWRQDVQFLPEARSRAVGSGLIGWNIPEGALEELSEIKRLAKL